MIYLRYYLLGYNAVQSIETQPTFRKKKMSPPSSWSKKKPSKKPVTTATCFHPGFLLGLFFTLEDGGDMFV
jgi:hypothetical protein